MTWDRYKDAMEKAMPPATTVLQTVGGVTLHIPCAQGHVVQAGFHKRMPPDKARKHLANQGWRFWGKSSTCPEHSAKNKDDTMPANDQRPPLRAVANSTTSDIALTAAAPGAPHLISPAMREARRFATMLLDEKFDVAKGRYKDGYSDDKVAKEAGVAVEWLIQRREEDFGPLKEPAEIAEIRERITAFQEKLDGYDRAEAAHRETHDKLRRDLHERMDALHRKLDVLAQRNGW